MIDRQRQPGQRRGQHALADVDQHHAQREAPALGAQRVGTAGVAAAQGADVDAVVTVSRRHDREFDGSLSIDVQNCLAFGRHGVNPLYRLCFRSFQGDRQVIAASLLHSYATGPRLRPAAHPCTPPSHSPAARGRDLPYPRAQRRPACRLR